MGKFTKWLIFTSWMPVMILATQSSSSPSELFNLNLIYHPDSNFVYSLPREVLESYLSGQAFDYQKLYIPDELEDLKRDISDIYQFILSENPEKEGLAIMTAGAPGTGKTTLLKQHRNVKIKQGKVIAYICPDDVCLQKMMRTYQKEIKEKLRYPPLNEKELKDRRQEGYNKWRPGSNGATHLILAHLIRQQFAFYFGTTSSSPTTGKFLEFLKSKDYTIQLLHLTAPDDVRWASIQERDKTFVQTTEQDIREKGKLVPQRINDTYLKFADKIEFYYRRAVNEDAELAAIWIRNQESSSKLGTLTIHDRKRYDGIKDIHNNVCDTLGRIDLLWETSVEQNSLIIE
jgi:hypothetical protein